MFQLASKSSSTETKMMFLSSISRDSGVTPAQLIGLFCQDSQLRGNLGINRSGSSTSDTKLAVHVKVY